MVLDCLTHKYSDGFARHILNEFYKRSLNKEGRFFQDYVQTGQIVMVVGCGLGSLSMQIAEKVGEQCFVHAVDVQTEQFPQQTPTNIQFHQASFINSHLKTITLMPYSHMRFCTIFRINTRL